MRHFEVLIPIWEMRPGKVHPRFTAESRPGGQTPLFRAFERLALSTTHAGDSLENTNMFRPASQNATLDEIFGCAQAVFPFLCALTIEGGHCKRPPKLRYFRNNAHVPQGPPLVTGALSVKNTTRPGSSASLMRAFGQENFSPFAPILHQPFPVALPPDTPSRLPKLMNTKTLILKGAWNIVRSSTDFSTLASALPSLREFHCTYHKPKTGAYAAISDSLNYGFPPTITHLNLCLEGLYTKNASSLKKWRKLYPHHHICRNLGAVTPQLESLTYTGRVCGAIFSTAMRAADQVRGSCTRLKSIDILVNNVCRRDPSTQNDGSGIHNLAFIQAFETLVVQGVRSLQIYSGVKSMRIRFIDLDSPVPQLNPMFHLEGRIAWGFWSEEILMLLKVARPEVRFLGWPGGLIDGGEEVPERDTSGVKRSMSAEYYKVLAQAGGGGLA